jgi:hypothetical protein
LRGEKSAGKGSLEVFPKVEWLAEIFADKCYFLIDAPMSLEKGSVYSVRIIPPKIS